ncbi:glycoside hydrolase family 95 protein [Olivibacter sp. SDN3]|uniref:glycoside hydrolase family 95 protein n=1 Tax=Olivibacter sp. SDN3 TaxID=2764720 RepID=UPI0016519B37|nr:glycoside hydrolase family 95 protein [Olivibacter sp. SDN3]QNL49566.1 glycoside hydrolase family 95 protein [Olivibacter sp. SDN3]
MERILFPTFLIVAIIAAAPFTVSGQNNDLNIYFDRPAAQWEETLPLGNGRLGMTPDGGIEDELIVLNDITLWSGAPQDANNYEAHKRLPEIRKLINEGRNDEAQALVDKDFICLGEGSVNVPFGCFQMLGNLRLKHRYPADMEIAHVTDYERRLSLEKALATTRYTLNGVQYSREYFTSFAGDVCLIRLSADQPHSIHLEIAMDRPEWGDRKVVSDILALSGVLESGTAASGMQYQAKVKPVLKDGTLRTNADKLLIQDASEVLLVISMGTDYKNDNYRNDIDRLLREVSTKSYEAERSAHEENYQRLFNRLSINLGKGSASALTTDKRLANFYDHPEDDLGLPALFFQFGRYLSISSTRVGLLPPNLQGLWANQIQTPWNGDYHLDVNVQMNHWPLEVANLSELNLPLADLVKGLVEPGERTAKAYYDADGWVAHVITNIWGFTEPGESASWGTTKAGAGWLCNNLWDHYAFTRDTEYLKEIYSVLKGSAQFYNSMLVEDPKTGFLVTSPSSSPENTFFLPNGKTASICAGPTIDNQIIRELFTNVIHAAQTLQVDNELVSELQETLKSIPPTGQVAPDGRLMEWMENYSETDPEHRHISHLYGLYPATLITPVQTPDLAAASKKTLEERGDDGPSWTIAYKLLFWARLLDGERSFKLLRELLKPTLRTDINYGSGGGVYPNMWSAGPPFQIDGNFGATAGIAEMLLQSHEDYIELLPATPAIWKAFGEIRGIRARDNITVNMEWENGVVTKCELLSSANRSVKVKMNGQMKTMRTKKAKH